MITIQTRTTLTVHRQSSSDRAEIWTVRVDQVDGDWGRVFNVQGELDFIDLPERWDGDVLLPPAHAVIPGARVPSEGPREHKSLHAAREDARRLAGVLSGQLRPRWTEIHT